MADSRRGALVLVDEIIMVVKWKVMEGDKEAYLEEATKALKRQRKTIDDLEKEKGDLLRSLKSAKSRKNNRKDGENAAKLARLAEEQVIHNKKFLVFFTPSPVVIIQN